MRRGIITAFGTRFPDAGIITSFARSSGDFIFAGTVGRSIFKFGITNAAGILAITGIAGDVFVAVAVRRIIFVLVGADTSSLTFEVFVHISLAGCHFRIAAGFDHTVSAASAGIRVYGGWIRVGTAVEIVFKIIWQPINPRNLNRGRRRDGHRF